jgi:squalene-hopene/tetraprenyl-beta-curcumene cyclase
MFTRREFTGGCLGLAAAMIGAPGDADGKSLKRLCTVIDEALARAVGFLASKQAVDGAWRSDVYGPLKDGPSLTAFIAATLTKVSGQPKAAPALAKAADYLESIDPDSTEITYPVYAAAGAVAALTHVHRDCGTAAREMWLEYLLQQQLVESLGWREADESFGGWSFAHDPPRPVSGQPASPMATPNLSATVFALDGLLAAGCRSDEPAIQKARVFVERCQNWPEEEEQPEAQFDDGGFFFVHGDETRNKAGEAGVDAAGRVRYVSYGSTTADGLRALVACGLPVGHPRVRAARRWMVDNFSATRHPGRYPTNREYLRPALYFYYCASAAEALLISGAENWEWASDLALNLLSCQRGDGCWANSAVDVREDDPLVATPLVISALSSCQAALASRS